MLIIGSAAGVAFMGMEKVDFFWYLRKVMPLFPHSADETIIRFLRIECFIRLFLLLQVSGFAFAGYAAGIAAYLALHNLNISLPTTIAEVPFILGS